MALILKKDVKVVGKITSCLSRGKVFVVFIDDATTPIIVAKRNVMEDGYVHRTQLEGVTITATPTQEARRTDGTVGQPGWLASVELPMAAMSANPLLQNRQRVADNYAMAALYAVQAAEEV